MKRLLPLFLSLIVIFMITGNALALPFAPKPEMAKEKTEKQENLDAIKAEMKTANVKLSKKQQKKLDKKIAKLQKKLTKKGINLDEFDNIEDVLDEPFFRLGLICILASLLLGLLGGLLFSLGGIFLWLSGILALVGVILLIIALLQVV